MAGPLARGITSLTLTGAAMQSLGNSRHYVGPRRQQCDTGRCERQRDCLLQLRVDVGLIGVAISGCVEAIAPQVQVTSGDVSTIYQGDVILGRLAMGADYLNPAASVELFAGTATKPAAF